METADQQIHEAASKGKKPLDVRIVAYFLYGIGFIRLAISILLASGIAEPAEPYHVLLGSVVISSGPADAVYVFCTGLWRLFCAWGLMRSAKFAWWSTLLFFVYDSTDAAFTFRMHPTNALTWIALDMAIIGWLWFRRRLFGIPGEFRGHL